jgi:hypothetical protein
VSIEKKYPVVYQSINPTAMLFLKKLTVLILSLQILIIPCMNGYAAVNDLVSSPPSTYKPLVGPNYPIDKGAYFTDDFGNILMVVNVLGQVGKPGQLVVRENVDFAELLSLVGDAKEGANLKKVIVARTNPDSKEPQVYKVDLKKFYKEGDTSSFIALKPNDTIIFPAKDAVKLAEIAQIASILFSGVSYYLFIKRL